MTTKNSNLEGQTQPFLDDVIKNSILDISKTSGSPLHASADSRKKGDKWAIFKQVLAAMVASLSSVSIGFITAYSSLTLPLLRNDTSIDFEDVRDSGWIASIPSISSIFGSLLGGIVMDIIGPRMTLIVTVIPCVLSWAFITFTSRVVFIYVGRFLTGIFLGIYSPVPQVYATEIAEPKIRGLMGALPEAAVALGSLLCYLLGSFLDWRSLSVAAALVPGIPLFMFMIILPESPQWLVKKNKLKLGKKSLEFFRNKSWCVDDEMKTIHKNILETDGYDISIVKQLRLFKKVQNWKPVLIVFLVFMCGQFSGFAVVTAYTGDIFSKANAAMDSKTSTVIVGIVRFVSTLISAVLLDRVGRRPLLVISAIGSSVGMVALGIFFYLQLYSSVEYLGLLPLISLLVYVFFNELGYGPIPWLLSGELIPLAVRTIGNGVAVTAYSLCAFIIGITFPMLTSMLSTHVTFWLYACFSLSGVLLGWYLPETRGKSLEEIEKLFIPKNK